MQQSLLTEFGPLRLMFYPGLKGAALRRERGWGSLVQQKHVSTAMNFFHPQHLTLWLQVEDERDRATAMKITTSLLCFAVSLLPQFEVNEPCVRS